MSSAPATTATPNLKISDHLPFNATAFAAHALSSPAALAAVIDHTLLKPEATRAQVIRLCHEAAEHRFACAMVNPAWVACAAETLAGTGIPVGVVIGFPLGASLAASKRDEAARVLKLGAHDLDMVLNIGLLKSATKQDYDAIKHEIRSIVELAHARRGHRQGHPRNLPAHLRGKTARLRTLTRRRGRLHQNLHRLLHPAEPPSTTSPSCAA